jgi:hypothetical protein
MKYTVLSSEGLVDEAPVLRFDISFAAEDFPKDVNYLNFELLGYRVVLKNIRHFTTKSFLSLRKNLEDRHFGLPPLIGKE